MFRMSLFKPIIGLLSVTLLAACGGGSDSKDDAPSLALPSIGNITAQTYTVNSAITTQSLTNSGGGSLTSCTADSLPAGLSVSLSGNSSTCEITGTPTAPQSATTHTITATNATGSDTGTVSITVNAVVPVLASPSLANASAQTYTVNSAIVTLSFTNSGGGSLSSCTVDSLPTGLSVALSSDNSTCEITGTPTATQTATTHTITATNVTGSDTATVSMTVNPVPVAPPSLANAAVQTYIEDTAITALTFANSGGASLNSCTADSLPAGLSVAVSGDSSTCEITGTPTAAQSATTHTITATNAGGSDAATVSIAVDPATPPLAPPSLANAAAQTYTENLSIATLAFVNSGGALLSSCTADSLPAGLSVAVSSDSSTCEISGTPTAAQSATTHTVTTTNASGSDSATVNITVDAALLAPVLANASAQTYTENSAITTLSFTNSGGGLLSSCVADTLPAGLIVTVASDNGTCEITGTPTSPQAATTHIITAINASGNDAASISITVDAELLAPALADASAQTYTENSTIATLSFVNNGGESLSSCSADTLPAGLSVVVSADNSTCEITGTPTTIQSATTHTITATNATGSDTATVDITVSAALPAPTIADASAQTYTQNSAILTLSFANSGGTSLSSCTADSLPNGLSVAVSGDSSTCEITGTPTAIQSATTYTITATNATGSDTATVDITVNAAILAPALADASAQTYTENSAITTLSFSNSGGGSLSSCSADSLPSGLSVAVSSDNSTCEITGTPTAIQSAITHTITATNATGSDTATVDITVNAALLAPALADASAQIYTENLAISTLSFSNSGGGSLSSCSADSLPTGLSVVVSSDNSTCEITGTPTTPQSATTHTITATNATGSDAASVNITVNAALAAPILANASAQTYTENSPIATLSFTNSGGGSLSSCTADSLPTGLSIAVSSDNSTCEITGTPTAPQSATTHTITATNATGNDTASVSITVDAALLAPTLSNASAQTYTENSSIATLSFSNSGGGSLSSCTADSLPTGLSVAISADSGTCEITGTPTAPQSATTHTITATNATGSDTGTVNITVNSAAPSIADASAQVYSISSTITALSLPIVAAAH